MKCPDETTIAEYLTGMLSPRHESIVAKHLTECETCLAVREGLDLTDAILRGALAPRPDPERLVERVMKRLRGETNPD